MYKIEKVSYGYSCSVKLYDGSDVVFDDNVLRNFTRIDERNLKFCLYLNLRFASITSLDTTWFGELRVLILWNVKINSINSKPLINVVFLHLSGTNISILDTSFLGELRVLRLYETRITVMGTELLINL